jgi:polysaccharide biosynthesis protein PelA
MLASLIRRTLARALQRVAASFAFLFAAAGAHAAGPANGNPTFAFYYGRDIPWEVLGGFDVAVVEPGNVGVAGWSHRLNPNTTVAAYIAVGEVHPTRSYFKQMRPEWTLGENKDWGSIVVDQAAPGWSAFYLAQVIKPLWLQGYRAFFLDTLDSFYLIAKTPEAQKKQIAGMVNLVREIKRAYPEAKLIFNRGFEILPEVNTLAYAVAAESLFQGWDAGQKKYREVPAADRDWILAQLRKCQTDYKLLAIAIDYVPQTNRVLARETAKKIKALGIIPWVTNPALDIMGVGHVEVLPRQVLAIHDEPGHLAQVALHEVQRLGTLPLNYLGLDVRHVYYGSPEFEAIAKLPLTGRYAGVLTWFSLGTFVETEPVMKLLENARTESVPIVIVDAQPGRSALKDLGIEVGDTARLRVKLKAERLSPHVGFEIDPKTAFDVLTHSTLVLGQGDVWLRLTTQPSDAPASADVVAVTPWGGFAQAQHGYVNLPVDAGSRWVINPIEFFKAAFKIDVTLPVPDITTESGRRLLLIHVDGDGFPSRAELPGAPLSGEVMRKEFLETYRWPSAISIIEGEVAPVGLYAALSPQMEKIARQIFALPHVEMASHTYSHPFYWADAERNIKIPGRVVSLQIPGYDYNDAREISGSRDYVDKLAPAGKKTKILLWSGNTEPLATPVRLAYEAGLLNMNGGFTTISKAEPSMTLVAPFGFMKDDYYQVYAPMQNENVYTNSWTGPFYGFERVIETFELTDKPQRLKPVNIYYHTYIATKRASIASLHKVYGWAQSEIKQQRLHPVHVSEYLERMLDWRRATVALTDEGLELRGGNHLRQWRVGKAAALPAVNAEAGIAGYVGHESVNYVHASKSVVKFAAPEAGQRQDRMRLESANSKLTTWQTSSTDQQYIFEGHLPLHARLYAPGCELVPATGLRATRVGDMLDIEGQSIGKTRFLLRCPQ